MRHKLLTLVVLLAAFAMPSVAHGQGVAGVGYDAGWQLGSGYRTEFTALPVASVGLPAGNVEEVAAGDGSSLALVDHVAYSVGGDAYGQCGCGVRTSSITHWTPVKFPSGTVVARVAIAGSHAMALTRTGLVYVWGGNLRGELANGVTFHGKEGPGDFSDLPLLVRLPHPAVAIVAGGASDFAQLNDGSLMDWGENKTGQLADGTMGVDRTHPVLAKVSGIKELSVGGIGNQGAHAVAVMQSGAILAWGAGGQGQLGNGTTKTSPLPVRVRISGAVSSVSSAVSHSLAVMVDGTVRAWGSNLHGALAAHTTRTCTKFLTPCSTVPIPVTGLSSVTQVSANFGWSLAISHGRAYAWGWNQYGQLGNGTRIDGTLPRLVSGLFGAQQISAGVHHGLFVLAGEPPPPAIAVTAGHLSLALAWQAPATTERWVLTWRPVTKPASPFGKLVYVPATARSYTVTRLKAGQIYEVLVKNKSVFGTRRVQGTPLR
jgi:alpha-tubulin suppressor-like RCC1 family protein